MERGRSNIEWAGMPIGSLGRVRRCKSKHPSRYPVPSGPVFQHPLFFAPLVSAPSPLVVGYEHSHPQRGLFQTWGRAEFSWIKLVLMNIALWYSIILKLTFKTSKMNFSKLWKLWKTGVLKLWKPLENRGLKLWKLWKWTLENSGHHGLEGSWRQREDNYRYTQN